MKLNENSSAVKVTSLVKGFGEGSTYFEVLHKLNLEARFGEVLLLVGPSGCGKTTLLCLIAGLLHADQGEIEVFGQSLVKMNEKDRTNFRRDHLGFIFQQFNLIPTLSARENAAIPLLIKNVARPEALERADEMLDKMGLNDRAGALPNKLSGGQQQRVAIARALVSQPKLLICDEPTASLDGDTGQKVMESLRSVARAADRCVIVVTHDSRIFKFGDRIARILDGKVVSVEDVTAQTVH